MYEWGCPQKRRKLPCSVALDEDTPPTCWSCAFEKSYFIYVCEYNIVVFSINGFGGKALGVFALLCVFLHGLHK